MKIAWHIEECLFFSMEVSEIWYLHSFVFLWIFQKCHDSPQRILVLRDEFWHIFLMLLTPKLWFSVFFMLFLLSFSVLSD